MRVPIGTNVERSMSVSSLIRLWRSASVWVLNPEGGGVLVGDAVRARPLVSGIAVRARPRKSSVSRTCDT